MVTLSLQVLQRLPPDVDPVAAAASRVIHEKNQSNPDDRPEQDHLVAVCERWLQAQEFEEPREKAQQLVLASRLGILEGSDVMLFQLASSLG